MHAYERRNREYAGCLLLLLLVSGIFFRAQPAAPEAISEDSERLLWQEPTDIRSRNLLYGSGGKANLPPNAPFTFLDEDTGGSSPKFEVRDAKGNAWKAKLGGEAKGEVAASRLVWAAGYFTDDVYFLPQIRVKGLPAKLDRGQAYVSGDNLVRTVRLERQPGNREKVGAWEWEAERWADRRDWNGLRVLMALLNNWDLKDSNTAVYAVSRPNRRTEYIYVVADLGASFGPRRLEMRRTKSDLKKYAESQFVSKVTAETVNFATPGTPSVLNIFTVYHFFSRLPMKSIGQDIPRSDARWMGRLLSRLSPKQIRDAFRGAGYAVDEVEGFARVVEERIQILAKL